MLAPHLLAWIEEQHDSSVYWIDCDQTGPLAAIALQARETEVVDYSFAAVDDRDQVIDFVGELDIVEMKQAVLTTIAGAIYHRTFKGGGDVRHKNNPSDLLFSDASCSGLEQSHKILNLFEPIHLGGFRFG